MLRPATPLSILFFAAFVLLLLSTLSTPIIKAIPLATVEGVNFGVLGYCRGDDCSGISVGYSTDRLSQNGDFSLPSSTRNSLSSILIVHPVATLLTLICFGLAVAAHFHAPAHSPKYLLALLILTFPTLLVTLLAFLVDLLLFVPHVAWGGWVVLAATIIIVASGVVTCAMRRTLVSRKARKKRIAENNEMNGVNYQASRNHPTIPLPRAESPPPLNTNGHNGDKLPAFAAFELQNNKQLSEDRTPLNPRNPSIRSASTNGGHTLDMDGSPTGYEDRPPLPSVTMTPGRNRGPPPRDQYGNPIPPQAMQRRRSAEGSMRSNGMNGGPPGYGRGRGGYPPRGGPMPRGGYGPRGGPQNPDPSTPSMPKIPTSPPAQTGVLHLSTSNKITPPTHSTAPIPAACRPFKTLPDKPQSSLQPIPHQRSRTLAQTQNSTTKM
ncbi:pali-domain-containing protein [Patellaria atrata CBS 101060]|uniref:Pali-domain-containing protein n=1 Tax=Patellaria atrata CBS 101060 TaxID=1346257 RepID=A0A9P4SCM8_9PEZI|nr:pali-domain-containing protein [Patellaria atrata CBS 101060]